MKFPYLSSALCCAMIVPGVAFLSPSTPGLTTSLHSKKNADRARMERVFEESMGDDWRVFRANLVAKEQDEARKAAQDWHRKASAPKRSIEEQGRMFGSELSSVLFYGGSVPSDQGKETLRNFEAKKLSKAEQRARLLKGDTIGVPPGEVQCEDPFASPAEMPCHLKEKERGVNRHRWAHPINHIEEGAIMIASENLGGVFHQTVLLIVDHHEKTGTSAVVINRPIPGNVLELSCDLETNLDEGVRKGFTASTVSYGGPVAPELFSCLHGYGEVDGSKRLAPGVFIGGSKELLNLVRLHRFDPVNALFTQGHAAWGPGHLEEEIENGVWYPASCSSDFLLRYAGAPTTEEDNLSDLWSDILTCMGGDYAEIARQHGRNNSRRMKP